MIAPQPPRAAPAPPSTAAACADPVVVVVEAGVEREVACAAKLPASSVAIDLRDAWTPKLFAPGPDGLTPEFRATYLAFASEQDVDGKPLPPNLALAELYGVVPSFAIVRARFSEQARYDCHAKIDSAPLAKLERPFGQEHDGVIKLSLQTRTVLGAQLERERKKRNLPDFTAFASDRELATTYDRWKAADDQHAGIVAAQRHLTCEGLQPDQDGTLTWKTGMALELFQRRNFLMPNNRLDVETRTALATDPRELDFRFALRVLRERVVDATGLIEDGTAGAGPKPILGRMLDPEAMRSARGRKSRWPTLRPI